MTLSNERTMNGIFPSNIIYMKFVQSHSDSEYDYICCVEGKVDEAFYRSINMSLFSENTVRFLYADYDANNKKNNHDVGKEAVVVSCEEIYKHHPKELGKCTFVVSHDYFGLDDLKYSINPEVKKFITVLPVYSFENYFMQDENLRRILKLHLNNNDINKFLLKYKQFSVDIREYFALKRTIYAKHLDYEKSVEDEDLFFFNFNKEPFFRVDRFQYERKAMHALVTRHTHLYRYFEKSKEILSSGTDFIKGKILLRFLIYYLKQVHEIDINMYRGKGYEDLVKRLQVDLDVILPSPQLHDGKN